ncbi:hypothetical protein JCM14124_12090 [Humidesulfovibrio idahonensis]
MALRRAWIPLIWLTPVSMALGVVLQLCEIADPIHCVVVQSIAHLMPTALSNQVGARLPRERDIPTGVQRSLN